MTTQTGTPRARRLTILTLAVAVGAGCGGTPALAATPHAAERAYGPGQGEVYRVGGAAVAIYNIAGEVDVVGTDGGDVVVELARGGRDAGELRVDIGRVGDRQALRVLYPVDDIVYPRMSRGSRTGLHVRPDGTFGGGGRGDRVEVRGGGAGLEAFADMRIAIPRGREVAIYLGVGEIRARNVDGDIRLDGSSARIDAQGARGRLVIDTGSGRVRAAEVDGELDIDTGSGSVEVQAVRSHGRVRIDTGSGRVRAADITAGTLEIDTGSGSIGLVGASAPHIELDTGSGSIEAELTSDVERLIVDTGSGSVRLRVPEQLGAQLEIDTGSGGIHVDVPLLLRSRQRSHLRGQLGDGRGEIRIDTGSGSVRILRR